MHPSASDLQRSIALPNLKRIKLYRKFQLVFKIMKLLGNVIKSVSDKRVYKALQLPNQLQCLIVGDVEAQKSSASLSVGAGSLQDPVDAQGLAHYLQHMLFMGTQKYPNQNEYSEFLSKNSGSSNAYTGQNETNYFFEVSSLAFRDTLDRFAQFFVTPLMSESSSERELNAVDSEHSKNILNDAWRKYQLWKSSVKAGHPLSKFSTGDKTTLSRPDIRNQLLQFYKNHYSANLMKLVVYGKEDVQAMSKYVEQVFGPIKNQSLNKLKLTDMPFDESNLGNFYKVVPVKDKQTVEFMWIVSSFQKDYKNSPGKYIGHLLGHQGPGSLLSLLIKQGLGLELMAGSQDQFELYTKLQVTVTLTDKGLKNIPLIASYLLYYIEMLKAEGPQRWVFDEIQKINKLKFDNMDKKQGMSFCAGLSKNMHNVPVEQVMVKEYLMEEWKPELIQSYLNQLKLSNLRIMATSQTFEEQCKLVEPIYKTKYSVQPLPALEVKKCEVSLPPKNLFFPQDLTILPLSKQQYPVKLYANDYLQLFFKPDHRFQLPKGIVKIRFYHAGGGTAKQKVSRDIYQGLLNNYLREIQYMGQTAHVQSKVDFHTYSVDIQIKGFNDSLSKFLPQYLDLILGFEPSDRIQFQDIRCKKQREYANFFMSVPYQQNYQYHILALRDGADVDPEAKCKQIQSITFQAIAQFGRAWKQQMFAEVYVGGNFTEAKSIQFGECIQKHIKKRQPLLKGQIKCLRAINLSTETTWAVEKQLLNPQQKNSSLILHFQYEQIGITTKLMQQLCQNFVKQPAFDYLRTKQQLGYIVMCLPDDNRGVLGISILVQSNVKSSHQLRGYIDNLMVILKKKLEDLTEGEFEKIKTAAYTVKLQKDKNLDNETTRMWGQITKHSYTFDRKQQQLKQLPKISLQQFKQFFTRVFLESPKKFETHLICSSHKQSSQATRQKRIESQKLRVAPCVEWFKKRMPLFPDFYALL